MVSAGTDPGGNAPRTSLQESAEDKAGREEAEAEEDGEVDYKAQAGFAKHIKSQNKEAKSDFAKTKSIAEQRAYLPVYTVRDELLSVVREHQVRVTSLFCLSSP